MLNSATYLSTEALDRLNSAQQVVNKHLLECSTCGTNRLCYDRIEAERVFLRYGRLPRRTPGLTGTAATKRTGLTWHYRL
ncbi:hypothetical protein O7632_25770 [Solwaraspora sp. WMMD406]|uniref:hypothetical protein n=1 Tax=Solwaraspora sp. WMMD406 TaxID=3016095 RepID=UPI0024176B43|nr:hypothetical protein [Solwaraspora sp. WMMD406]MDG4767473.1 hypothetical protein [Solwaraspora sp. WMMD406]